MRNNQGYVLVSILLVVVLLTILGGAYAVTTLFEIRSSTAYGHRMQAYYYAKSGLELGYKYLLALDDEDRISNFLEAEGPKIFIFGSIGGSITISDNDNSTGDEETFAVIEVLDQNDEKQVSINAVGRHGASIYEVEAALILRDVGEGEFKPPQSNAFFNNGELKEGYYSASDKDFTQTGGGSPVIKQGGSGALDDKVVFHHDKHDFKVTTNDDISLIAKEMYFTTGLDIDSSSNNFDTRLSLTAERIIFYEKVEIDEHSNHGSGFLCLQAPINEKLIYVFMKGLYLDSEKKGKIENEQVYFVPPGGKICFPNGIPQLYDGDGGYKPVIEWDPFWL